jgi:hypothetical protein
MTISRGEYLLKIILLIVGFILKEINLTGSSGLLLGVPLLSLFYRWRN